ncbi:MAG TPA: hypothetical protein VMB34_05795 [Acetobacteraceae bacterium]|nr:hypothetical protein [Acetobacteraceae bacterium]
MQATDSTLTAGRRLDPVGAAAALINRLTGGRTCWWSLYAALCLALVAPLFVVQIPPLTDYPNHLAREFVLAFGAHDPILSRIYGQSWGIIPNLAIDIVMPPLLHIVPLYDAGRMMLALALLLPVAGVAAYHRAAFQTRSFWPLASGLVAYNGLFLLGFMNFLISVGMALLGAAAWVAWRQRRPFALAVLGAVWSCAIFFAHIFGLLFLVLIIGGWEFDRLLRLRREHGRLLPDMLRTASVLTPVFLPPLVLSCLAPIADARGMVVWRPPADRLRLLLQPFITYDPLTGLIIGILFLALLFVLVRQRRCRLAPGAGWTMLVLLAVYAVCPFIMNNTAFIGDRFPVMLGFMLFAGTRPQQLPAVARSAIVVLLTAAFAIKTVGLMAVWQDHNADLRELRQVIAPVPAGSRTLVVSLEPTDNPQYWLTMREGRWIPGLFRTDIHLPALLLIEHRSFWPLLFTARGKQPLVLLPPYDRLDGKQGVPPDYHVLEHPITAKELSVSPYLAHWQTDFDYVLLLDAGGAGDLHHYMPDKLQLLESSDFAALFRIVH